MEDKLYCLSCGEKELASQNGHRYACASCEFQIYHNVASTVSLILKVGDEILFAKRARDPSKGMLDFPGGFVDPGESLEEALLREMSEELGWKPMRCEYLFSFPNTYFYADVLYNTADAFFLCELSVKPKIKANDDVASLIWIGLEEVPVAQLGFESMRRAVSKLASI